MLEATETELALVARVEARMAEVGGGSGSGSGSGSGGSGGESSFEGSSEPHALPGRVEWSSKDEETSRSGDESVHQREACVANAVKQRLYSVALAAAAAAGSTLPLTMFTVTNGFANARELATTSCTGLGEYVPPAPHITCEPTFLYVVQGTKFGSGGAGSCARD